MGAQHLTPLTFSRKLKMFCPLSFAVTNMLSSKCRKWHFQGTWTLKFTRGGDPNLVPRVLSLPRESTLVVAGHVSMYTNQIPIGGGFLT